MAEFKVGQEFKMGLSRMKCKIQKKYKKECEDCYFRDYPDCKDITENLVGPCRDNKREDGKDVVFVKL